MRSIAIVISVAVLGCGASEQCSGRVSCSNGGSYQACTSGSSCRILASDGTSFNCNSCSDCQAATAKAASWCGSPSVGGNGGGGGGGGGNGGGNGGAPGVQAQACIDYLSCAAVYTPSTFPALVGTYGPSGTCWQSTQALADSCTMACQSSLSAIRANPSAPAVCGGYVPAPDMSGLGCQAILRCEEQCTSTSDPSGCDLQCFNRGSSTGRAQFQALGQCILRNCANDMGTSCTNSALSPGGACYAQAQACM
jgi:hypothetical protein